MLDENGNEIVDPAVEMLNEGAPPPPPVDYQKLYETMQANNQALMQQNQQLAVTVQQVAQRPNTQQVQQQNTPDPLDAFQGDTKAALKAALDAQAKQFQSQLAATQAQFANMSLEQEAASIASVQGLNADQITRAQNIFRGNRAKGIPINASECVDVVLGADFRAGKITLGNRAPPPVINGGSRPPNVTAAKPADVSKLSYKEQIAYYEGNKELHETPIKGIWDDAD